MKKLSITLLSSALLLGLLFAPVVSANFDEGGGGAWPKPTPPQPICDNWGNCIMP